MGGGICQVIFMSNPTTEVVLRCVVVGVVTTLFSDMSHIQLLAKTLQNEGFLNNMTFDLIVDTIQNNFEITVEIVKYIF